MAHFDSVEHKALGDYKHRQLFEKQVLTVPEAANLLGVSERTIYRLVKSEKIGVKRVGRQLRFSLQVLTDWVKEGG